MSLLFGKKHYDIRAWEDVLFEGTGNHSVQPDIALYERLTKAQIENDCRIILESTRIMAHTSDPGVAESRRKLTDERYAHLMTLKPLADTWKDTAKLMHTLFAGASKALCRT